MGTYSRMESGKIAGDLINGGSQLGGAVGEGMQTVGYGMESAQAFQGHQWAEGVEDAGSAVIHAGEAYKDGESGHWL